VAALQTFKRAAARRVAGVPVGMWAAFAAAIVVAIWKRRRIAQAFKMVGGSDWVERIVARTSAHEGGYDSLNRNSDGAGLSFGIIQWAQRPGTLGKILAKMYASDPVLFSAIFGSDSQELLRATQVREMGPIGGVVLWQEPWISRFKEAGKHPKFQEVQRREALEGEYMQAAVTVAKRLGVKTERAVALFFDTAVQQGPGAARNIADTPGVGSGPGGKALLRRYADAAASRFRSTTGTGKLSSHLRWEMVDGEYHAFAGKIDLYKDISRRRHGIVDDPLVKDLEVPV